VTPRPRVASLSLTHTLEWFLDCPVVPMLSRQKLDCTVLIGAVALARFLFRSRYLYDLDSVNFALAIGRFDPAVHQPHPPGYFLYVCLGRLVNALFHDPNAALVAISIAASCGAAAMIYLLTNEWFGTRAARFAGALFLVSPLAWFHGIVALTYIVEAFFSALIGYICWRVHQGSIRWILPAALVLGLAAGVRPSSLLFLGPLFLFSLRRAPRRMVFTGIGALVATLLAWFVPMISAAGGPAAYFSALSFLWSISPGRQNALSSILLLSVARFFTVAGIFVLCFGSAIALFARALWTRGTSEPRQQTFTWVWIAPALLFFTFVFFRFINSGYVLVVFPPICAWVAWWASDWYLRLPFSTPVKAALVGVATAINVAIFLEAPVYCSYREVRSFEAELESVQRALPQVAAPGRTLVIAFDSHFLGFRHAGYYFPDYTIAEYPEVRFPLGNRIFTMHHRDTRLVNRIATKSFANFVLFPLPRAGNEYRQPFNQMRAMLRQQLRTTTVEDCQFLTAPIEDLPVLFPLAAAPDALVYTARDIAANSVYKR
jgi:hypothetical protein